MEYRNYKGKFYGIAAPNECWTVNPTSGTIKLEKIVRKIDAIKDFPIATKEEYEDAYVACLNMQSLLNK